MSVQIIAYSSLDPSDAAALAERNRAAADAATQRAQDAADAAQRYEDAKLASAAAHNFRMTAIYQVIDQIG